jgi:hypothetical protein
MRWVDRTSVGLFDPSLGLSTLCLVFLVALGWPHTPALVWEAGDVGHQPPYTSQIPVAASVRAGMYANEWEGLGIGHQHESRKWGKRWRRGGMACFDGVCKWAARVLTFFLF